MNKHSIVLFVLLVAIGVGMGAAIDWQKSQAPALGAAGGTASAAAATAPAGGGLVINGMAVGAPAAAGAAATPAAPESPAAVTPAHSADAAACP